MSNCAREVQRRRRLHTHGKQLIQRIELHELYAGIAENLLARHRREQLLHHAVGARVAIMARRIEQQAVGAQQAVIDSPGIDADAVERQLALARCHRDAVLDLVPETQCVPVKRALHAHGSIGEAVQFFYGQLAGGEAAQQRAPAFGAQIDGEVVAHGKRNSTAMWGSQSWLQPP